MRKADLVATYRHEHPIALWMTLGFGIVGALALIAPKTVEETATSTALPSWLHTIYYAFYMVGGLTAWYGLHRAKFDVEAFGEVVLGVVLLAQFASIIYVRPASAVPAIFVLFTAIGVLRRAWLLVHERR